MFILFGDFVGNFNSFANQRDDQALGEFEQDLERLCLYVFALFLARFGLGSIHKFAFRMTGIRLSAALRQQYLEHLFGQTIHVLDSMPSGHAVGTITVTSNTLQLGISEKLGNLIEYTSLIIAALIVAFTWDWELALVTSAGFVVIVLIVGTIFPLTVKGQARQAKSESQAATIANETFASIRMVMACGAQQQMIGKYRDFIEDAKKHARATSPLTSLQFGLTTIGKATLAACEFFSVIDAPLPERASLKSPEVSADQDIVFENVVFAYPSRPDIKILDQFDLRIEAGKVTAIVGPSGSGKSTIVNLVERWYSLSEQYAIPRATPQESNSNKKGQQDDDDRLELHDIQSQETRYPVNLQGSVKTCGHSLDDLDVKWWRSQIGLVQQEPFLFNDTVYANVARGLVGTPWEEETEVRKRQLVMEACKEAFAHEFIEKLPMAYDTTVGDRGMRLSGGQRQRIAIARSIVKKPCILILDEATSALDVHGERIVQTALNAAAKGRTTIVIAHRLSTIKHADRIVVLKKGKVVESGTHEDLLSTSGGVYAALVSAQTLTLGDSTQVRDDDCDDSDTAGVQDLACESTRINSSLGSHVAGNRESVTESRGFFRSFGQFFFESKAYWNIMAFSLITSAAAGTAQPLYAWLFSKSIDLFKYQENHSRLMNEVDFMAGMWTVFAASASIAYFLPFASLGRVASFIRAKYQTHYFESLVFQRATYFDQDEHSSGSLASRVRDDPAKLEEMMGVNIAQVCIAVGNVIAGIIMALAYSWKLALVSISALVPVCLFSGYIRFRNELLFEKMNDEVFAESSHFASEAIGAFRTVTSLNLEDSIITRFDKLCHGHVIAASKKARWVSIVLGFSDSATLGCQALVFYYGGRLLARGEIDVMAFFVCLMALMNAAEGFGQSLSFGPNAAMVTAASNRILDARESRFMEQNGQDDIPATGTGIKIELRDICLRYSSEDTLALDGLNMTIEKGQFAALVGASGCGKSSIISLLERFYEPEKGQILFNGRDISKMDIYTYRKHLALVAQEPTLFQGTIRDNILLGMDPSNVTEDHLHAACRDASVHDFIVSLPDGYSTSIGSNGVSLSGGQKQRISIARALIRNPQILLLDEATSALDSESEKVVQQAFERAATGRTMIAVAHRLATVQNADVIFVLGDGGRLLEKGSHSDLLKKRGVYYQMCLNQALDQ
ncbi:hypothetical protein NW762_013631 [Fusarium torreyae]|uniref:ABC transporter n=1 Tax=Fusarium torreyae TaxID=1237075 RepID=A0A9W8VA78_9HYPO|nr:hypothetical protein NW762_013631 [Fusarium torreyae]